MKKFYGILAAAAVVLAVASCGNKKTAENEPAQTVMTEQITTPNPENAALAQQFLKQCGTAEIFEGKLYIQTGKVKNVYKQLLANPKAEICGFSGGQWIRIACELIPDDRVEAKRDMLDKNPSLRGSYDENDDNTIVLFCRNAHATISSFTADPVTFEF